MRKFQSKAVIPVCMVICAILIGISIYHWQFTHLMITAPNGDIICPGFEEPGLVNPEFYPFVGRFGTDFYSDKVQTIIIMSLIFWLALCMIIFIHIQLYKRMHLKYYLINIAVNVFVGVMPASILVKSASPIVGLVMVTSIFSQGLNNVEGTIWKYAMWLMFIVFSSYYWMLVYVCVHKLKSKLT